MQSPSKVPLRETPGLCRCRKSRVEASRQIEGILPERESETLRPRISQGAMHEEIVLEKPISQHLAKVMHRVARQLAHRLRIYRTATRGSVASLPKVLLITGSRMREICTHGLMRGPPHRKNRVGRLYSTILPRHPVRSEEVAAVPELQLQPKRRDVFSGDWVFTSDDRLACRIEHDSREGTNGFHRLMYKRPGAGAARVTEMIGPRSGL